MADSELNSTATPSWIEQLQAAIAGASSEVLLALTEPSAFSQLGVLSVTQSLREMLRQHPQAKVLILADSVNTILQVWPRFAHTAQWYGHQMHVQITDATFKRKYDVCVVDRRWVAYAPLSNLARSSDVWRCNPSAGNPVATRAMEEALEVLKRSRLTTWGPIGLA